MRSSLSPPLRVQRLKICPIIGDQHAAVLGRVAELVFVGYPAVGAPDFVHRNCVDPVRPQTFRDARAQILVEQEAQAHCAWFSAIRASISSG